VAVPDYLQRLAPSASRTVVPGVLVAMFRPGRVQGARAGDGRPVTHAAVVRDAMALLVPLMLTVGTFGMAWWYVVVYNAPQATAALAPVPGAGAAVPATEGAQPLGAGSERPEPLGGAADQPQPLGGGEEKPEELGAAAGEPPQELGAAEAPPAPLETPPAEGPPEEMTSAGDRRSVAATGHVPEHFYAWFWGLAAVSGLLLLFYYWRMNGEQLEILKELIVSVVPLGILTVVVLAVILLGITTATESAAIGALGALYLAVMAKHARQVWTWSVVGFVIGFGLAWWRDQSGASLLVAGAIAGTLAGVVVPGLWNLRSSAELRQNMRESTFLTAKTTAMVCWLFIGSALFSAVFALHGGQGLVERWVLGMNLSPLGFLIMAQLIIFLLGWPLEWTEIIVIFVPIFIPLLSHFSVDPILFGTMVAVNLQAAFLSPPVAMSAFYLKGVSPKHVTINQIFAGMLPYMVIVLVCLAFMYVWPGMTLWLPEFLYGQ
jgi:TRAP-type mannitol/chloroaromatic compound transport system permease large subunit